MGCSARFLLQYGPHTKVQRIQVRRWRRPRFLPPKRRKVTLTPILSFIRCVRWRTVLLKGKRPVFEVLLHLDLYWSQNILDIRFCVNFSALFDENKRRSPTLRDGSPNHHRGRLLATENSLYGWRDTVSTFCQNSVVLGVEFGLHSEHFLIRKDDLTSLRAIFHCIQKDLWSIQPLLFLQVRELLPVGHFERGQLEVFFDDGSHTFSVDIQTLSDLSHASLGVPPYPLPNAYDFGWSACSARSSTPGSITCCPQFLVAFNSIPNSRFWCF